LFPPSRAKRPYIDFGAVKRPIGEWANSRLARLGPNDTTRQNSANASGFGRNISRWAERKTVLPDNVLSLPLVGRNKGHPAVFPVELPAFFIRLLSPENGLVIDPFPALRRRGRPCRDPGLASRRAAGEDRLGHRWRAARLSRSTIQHQLLLHSL
jgi:DNA methylase